MLAQRFSESIFKDRFHITWMQWLYSLFWRLENQIFPSLCGILFSFCQVVKIRRTRTPLSSGAKETRTLDLCIANAALSQLSYRPGGVLSAYIATTF